MCDGWVGAMDGWVDDEWMDGWVDGWLRKGRLGRQCVSVRMVMCVAEWIEQIFLSRKSSKIKMKGWGGAGENAEGKAKRKRLT